MSTRKIAISSLILGAATFFSLGAPWPLSAQTSETSATAAQSSEVTPSKTTDTGKAKHAEGSYSSDQVPDGDVPSTDQLIKLLREQNARLKAENAQLKAEIAKLKASK